MLHEHAWAFERYFPFFIVCFSCHSCCSHRSSHPKITRPLSLAPSSYLFISHHPSCKGVPQHCNWACLLRLELAYRSSSWCLDFYHYIRCLLLGMSTDTILWWRCWPSQCVGVLWRYRAGDPRRMDHWQRGADWEWKRDWASCNGLVEEIEFFLYLLYLVSLFI